MTAYVQLRCSAAGRKESQAAQKPVATQSNQVFELASRFILARLIAIILSYVPLCSLIGIQQQKGIFLATFVD